MKEVQRTPVPLPGSKKTLKPKPTPSKAPLSQEFITSDDDDATPQSAPNKTTIAVHRPKSNGDTSSKSKTKTKAKESAPAKAAPKTTSKPKKPEPKQIVQQDVSDMSDSELSDDNDLPKTRDITTKLPGSAATGNGGDSDVDMDSSSSSDSDSSSEESEDEARPPAKQAPMHAQKETPRKQTFAVESRPVSAFAPPRGFNPVPLNEKTVSESTQIFDNMKGKEIWHMTAPAGVTLKDLSKMAMDQVINGGTILEHKGTGYGFVKTERNQDVEREVLLPAKNGLRAAPARISRTLHLQATVKLPKLSLESTGQKETSESSQSITRSTIRAPRPQVKGLKMRFLPIGSGDGNYGVLGESDSEDDVQVEDSELRVPSRTEKRRHSGVNGQTAAEVPAKKHKKNRTPEEQKARDEKKAKKQKQRQKA